MKSRKLVAIVIVVIVTAAFVNFLREGADWPLPQALPGCDGKPLSLTYLLGGVAIVFLVLWGLRRLGRSADKSGYEDTEPYGHSNGDSYEDTDDPEDEDYEE